MNESESENIDFFLIKIVQSGEIERISLIDQNLNKKFKEIYYSLLKQLRFKEKDILLSSDEGKALSDLDLKLSLKEIIEKFGPSLNLYNEKIM